MTKLYLIVGAIVLALVAGAGWKLHRALQKGLQAQNDLVLVRGQLRDANDALEAVKSALERSEKTSLARQKLANQRLLEAQAAQKALHAALQASPEWAGTPVPDGVRRALDPSYSDGVDSAPGAAHGANPGAPAPAAVDKRGAGGVDRAPSGRPTVRQ